MVGPFLHGCVKSLVKTCLDHFGQFTVQVFDLRFKQAVDKWNGSVPWAVLFFQPEQQATLGHITQPALKGPVDIV